MTDPLIAAARFLSAQLSWLRHATDQHGQPVAADVFRDIGDCAARMRSLVDGPTAGLKYLGPCGETWDIGTLSEPDKTMTCNGAVRWRPGSPVARCEACKTEHNPDQRHAWIDQVRRDFLYTATEIAEAYPSIKANTISKWAGRGLLATHGKHGNSPLFKVSEVLDLAASDTARREEIRAQLDRRRQLSAGA